MKYCFYINGIILFSLFSIILNLRIRQPTISNRKTTKMNEYMQTLLDKPFQMNTEDSVSYSQNEHVIQKHIMFDVDIDMDKKLISGKTRIFYHCKKASKAFILDILQLQVKKVLSASGESLMFKTFHPKEVPISIGDGLAIMLNDECKTNSYVDIFFSTTPRAIGFHFSDPIVLRNKELGFLYTHGEAIYGRTFFPSQDTPSLKVTTEAVIRIKEPYTVLFSGLLKSTKNLGKGTLEYKFTMDLPIPTYLITFTAGSFKKVDLKNSRCTVYYEAGNTELEEKIFKTFEQCESYIRFYENTYKSKFEFGKMIFLITPRDYPYKGMENPYVTYIAESVLTNDHSFDGTLAHEIAHFWSGNLVTNRNWSSFWLNEGITTYTSRKALKEINGPEMYYFNMYKGLNSLKNAIKDLSENSSIDKTLLSLTPNAKEDPYLTFSRVPYEKGSFFLYHIEQTIGEKKLNKVLGAYFNKFKFTSVTAEDFKQLFEKEVDYESRKNINWNEWTKSTGSLPVKFEFKSKTVERFKSLLNKVLKENLELKDMRQIFKDLKIVEKDLLLDKITDKLSHSKFASSTITNLKILLKDNQLFGQHVTNQANCVILLAKLENDEDEKEKILLESLVKNEYYGASHLKKVFTILKGLKKYNLDPSNLVNVVEKHKTKLNPLTYARIIEKIHEK